MTMDKRSLNRGGNSRRKIPAAWEKVLPYFNHSELQYINQLAKQLGLQDVPFPMAEVLPEDNGERFFSEYMAVLKNVCRFDGSGVCVCQRCKGKATRSIPPVTLLEKMKQQEVVVATNSATFVCTTEKLSPKADPTVNDRSQHQQQVIVVNNTTILSSPKTMMTWSPAVPPMPSPPEAPHQDDWCSQQVLLYSTSS